MLPPVADKVSAKTPRQINDIAVGVCDAVRDGLPEQVDKPIA
jgi:hypothetical protein